jgi:hypothetical protein
VALTRICIFCLEPQSACVCPDLDDPVPAADPPVEEDVLYHVGDDAPQHHGPACLDRLAAPAEGAKAETPDPEPYRGVIVITWPAAHGASPYSSMPGYRVEITDALTGKPITTCTGFTVRMDPEALVTAGLTMFADEAGEPILDGMPVPDRDGEQLRTGVFPFLVSEMRVRPA